MELFNLSKTMTKIKAILLTTIFALLAAVSGCQFNPDPTELNVYVAIRNDLRVPVHLMNCKLWDLKCGTTTGDIGVVRPNGVVRDVFTQVGVPHPVLVLSIQGARVGCLPLRYKSGRLVPQEVLVSSAVRC